MNIRIDNLLQRLSELNADAAIIHKPSNIFYLSGYTGEGNLFIAPGIACIITDFRYTEQAEAQAPGYSVHMIEGKRSHDAITGELANAAGARIVAFEDDHVTVAGMRAMKNAMPDMDFVPIKRIPEQLRTIKDDGEIELISKACKITSESFDYICGIIQPGITEKEIEFELGIWLRKNGSDANAFSSIVASGPNGSLPHAIPGDRKIQNGELVTLDYGASYGGYCSDMTRTVAVGKISGELAKIYDTVLTAQLRVLDALAPGANCREVDALARKIIDDAGYAGRFGHGLGHGLGIDIHEAPRLSSASTDTLKPGMLVTDEPGIYIPGLGGCRIEDTVLITQTGCKKLTTATKELITL